MDTKQQITGKTELVYVTSAATSGLLSHSSVVGKWPDSLGLHFLTYKAGRLMPISNAAGKMRNEVVRITSRVPGTEKMHPCWRAYSS